MIKIGMKSHIVSNNNCNIVNPQHPKSNSSKELQIMLGLNSVLVTLHGNLQSVLSKAYIIGDTEYNV